ncbi:MAG: hypothetical protein FWC20_09980 [Oscillospiraceae bacterium]|nr:hypothetical protein [Oscillospiraceae bacterium]MCL2279716.1 hypothetical protein [Oscillospiraceae bacterium]
MDESYDSGDIGGGEVPSDTSSDIGSDTSSEPEADYGGDLASDEGTDLGGDYTGDNEEPELPEDSAGENLNATEEEPMEVAEPTDEEPEQSEEATEPTGEEPEQQEESTEPTAEESDTDLSEDLNSDSTEADNDSGDMPDESFPDGDAENEAPQESNDKGNSDNRFRDGARRVGVGLGAAGAAAAGVAGALPPEDMSGRDYPTDTPAIYQEAPHHVTEMHNNSIEDNLHEQFPEYSFSIPNEDDTDFGRRDALRQLGQDATAAGKAWVDLKREENELDE